MAKGKEVGVFQKEDGYWGYRFSIIIDGKQIAKRKFTDEKGNKLRTKSEAVKAREAAMVSVRTERADKPKIARRTYEEVFEEFRSKGRTDRAYQTIRKQDSLWENHIKERFGKRFVDEISSAEINDYLAELYYDCGYSFMYTESFLKMFYLILGQAYSRNYLDVDLYNKFCQNKDTKIRMPKNKTDDDTDIVAFSREELSLLDDYFKGTNAETAYLLGRYCGLRINEAFGLRWKNVDLEKGTILIDRQMQYQDGLIKLVSPKTFNANRTIFLPNKMWDYRLTINKGGVGRYEPISNATGHYDLEWEIKDEVLVTRISFAGMENKAVLELSDDSSSLVASTMGFPAFVEGENVFVKQP